MLAFLRHELLRETYLWQRALRTRDLAAQYRHGQARKKLLWDIACAKRAASC